VIYKRKENKINMWYRQAKKFNIFGLPISGDLQISQFSGEDEEIITDETPLEIPEIQEPELEDPTPEDEFTPQDLEQKVEQMTEDPTAGLQLPPLHNNCRCRVKTLPFLSQPGLKDGRRVWERSEECCGACELSAKAFNEAEVQRLLNKGIDVNRVS
jgi:hypothetical protein